MRACILKYYNVCVCVCVYVYVYVYAYHITSCHIILKTISYYGLLYIIVLYDITL